MDSSNKPGLQSFARFVVRMLTIWLIQVGAMALVAWLHPGVQFDSVLAAVVAVAVITIINAVVWPLLSFIIVPFAVLTLGLATLVVNGAVIYFASQLIDGFFVSSIWTAILLSLGLTIVSAALGSVLNIDDDSAWYRNVLRRHMRRRVSAQDVHEPGVLFIEFDGLAKPVLERAVADGRMPTVARWLESGSHRLVGWETDLSSQTSASQAGILHGSNHNIPAFRWFDREAQEIRSSSSPRFVAAMEERLSDGNGLLACDGASRGNLLSGDAPQVMNTASKILDTSRFHAGDFYAFFLHPYTFSRTLMLTIWDMLREIWQFRQARRRNDYPILDREHRGGVYPLLRAFTTVLMRELNVYTLIGDIFAAVPAAYSTFVGYDEVAHHSGVESRDAFQVLTQLDKQLERLERAVQEGPREYQIVLLSDHGQTGGATFKQRYGLSLEELVHKLAREKYHVRGDVHVHEDWGHVNAFLTETVQYDRIASKPLGQVLKGRTDEGQVALGPEGVGGLGRGAPAGTAEGPDDADPAPTIVVLASGNLGLVYGTRDPRRATFEEIEEYYPGLLQGLAEHEGIGFVMVHADIDGAVVIGAEGRNYLAADRVDGVDPLEPFGPNAAHHLRRYDGFPDAPDIYVSSFYDPATNEGAAFEEQIGFHGGMGGPQTEPFLLYPAQCRLSGEPLVGAASVHRELKAWVPVPSDGGSEPSHALADLEAG
jgi:uncharacterized membrane protein YvlD (DUF360 family)